MRWSVLTSVCIALIAPASGNATSVVLTAEFGQPRLVVTGGAGEQNHIMVRVDPAAVLVTDTGAPVASVVGCRRVNANTVTCPRATRPRLVILLEDRDDKLQVRGGEVAEVYAGPGNDRIDVRSGESAVQGDEGDDDIVGGDGRDAFLGGAGRDVLRGGGGDDSLAGETGSDRISGGAGRDTLDPGERTFGEMGRSSNRVRCGPGRDYVDGPAIRDLLARDCEILGVADNETFPGRIFPVSRTRSRLAFRIPCLGETEDCSGRMTLRDRAGKVVGRGRFTILKRQGGRVRVALTSHGRRLLARPRGAIVRIRARYATGAPALNYAEAAWSANLRLRD